MTIAWRPTAECFPECFSEAAALGAGTHSEARSMKIITDDRCTGYTHPGHPERPERLSGAWKRLRSQVEILLQWGGPRPIENGAIVRAHSAEHVARLDQTEPFDEDTPAYPGLASFASASVGAALTALEAARAGENVFSLMRPPGHHATRTRAMGFCYLNNTAIAVLEALASGIERVAVFDFDVHHGNGTEAILLNQPGVQCYSIHQHPCYPGTGTRNVGNNCYNFPLPPQTPRLEYRQVLAGALEHLAAFRPQLVAVSAGFDAYARDPLAQQTLEMEDFYWLGGRLRGLGLPVFSLLEGGYSTDLPDLILAYLRGIEGK
jgi:acetoin utilization deacetylase AcuC-like enzyme